MMQVATKSLRNKRQYDYLFIIGSLLIVLLAVFFTPKDDSDSPIFAVLDETKVIQSRLDDGDTPAKALVYYKTLLRFYSANGVTIFHEKAMVSYPDSMIVTLPAPKHLFTLAAEKGITITDQDIEDAQAEIEEQERKILNSILLNPSPSS